MAKIGGLVTVFFLLTYLPYYTIMFRYRLSTPPLVKLGAAIIVISSYNFDAFMYGYCNKNYRRDIRRWVEGTFPWLAKVSPLGGDTTDNNQEGTLYSNTPQNSGVKLRNCPSPAPRFREHQISTDHDISSNT